MQHIKNKKIQTKIVSSFSIVPFLLIILQNDTGTALVYSSFILVLYREGGLNNANICSNNCNF